MPPPGLLRLGGALERAGHEVVLEDLAFRQALGQLGEGDQIADRAAERLATLGHFDALGLSVMGATLPIALAIAARLRALRPGPPIALGGPGCNGVESAVLERFPAIDLIVRGEGELSTCEWLERLADGRTPAGVAGISWRDASGRVHSEENRRPIEDLSLLADCAWHLLPALAEYKAISGESEGLVPIDSGRGCVYDCSFCTIGRYWSRRSRPLPAQRLAEEVQAAAQLPGARQVYLCHDLFGADRAHARQFCEQMIERGARVPWECRARIDHLDAELCALMARAGCYRVLVGIESAAPAVRARNSKGMRADIDLLSAIDACTRVGIVPILSLILGLPGEGEAELRQSLDFCMDASLRAGVNVSLHLVNPQPGCGLGQEFGARSRPVAGIAPDMAVGTGQTRCERELIEAHPDIFSTWALLPLPEAHMRELARIARELPPLLMRLPRTFALLARRSGADCLDCLRAGWSLAASLEQRVAASGDALLESVLAWELALARVAAADVEAEAETDLARLAGAPGELLESRHELGLVRDALLTGGPLPPASSRPRSFALLRTPERERASGGAPHLRTLELGSDLARLLQASHSPAGARELARHAAEIQGALAALAPGPPLLDRKSAGPPGLGSEPPTAP